MKDGVNEMSNLTVCLLNWRRPANLSKILQCLQQQSAKPRIFIWNNAATPLPYNIGNADWVVNSSQNKLCFPRWYMASQADTKWVMSLDDDLMLADDYVLEEMINFVLPYKEKDIIFGLEGVVLKENKSYSECNQIKKRNFFVDIVKGRIMLLRRQALNEVKMHWKVQRTDDIALSGLLAKGRAMHHRIIPWLHSRINELDAHDGLCDNALVHYSERDIATKQFFWWNYPSDSK